MRKKENYKMKREKEGWRGGRFKAKMDTNKVSIKKEV